MKTSDKTPCACKLLKAVDLLDIKLLTSAAHMKNIHLIHRSSVLADYTVYQEDIKF